MMLCPLFRVLLDCESSGPYDEAPPETAAGESAGVGRAGAWPLHIEQSAESTSVLLRSLVGRSLAGRCGSRTSASRTEAVAGARQGM